MYCHSDAGSEVVSCGKSGRTFGDSLTLPLQLADKGDSPQGVVSRNVIADFFEVQRGSRGKGEFQGAYLRFAHRRVLGLEAGENARGVNTGPALGALPDQPAELAEFKRLKPAL